MHRIAASIALLTTLFVAACDDNTFTIDPRIVTDTIELAGPLSGSALPSALDITANMGVIGGGRFPERQEDAARWDFAIRTRDGEVLFVPAGALGMDCPSRRCPGITNPMTGQTLDQIREAPGSGQFNDSTAVAAEVGAVYVARSRGVCGFGGAQQYAKLQPLEVVPEEGRVRLVISVNEVCGDPRLVESD